MVPFLYHVNIEVPAMSIIKLEANHADLLTIRNLLQILGIPIHRKGYYQLTVAITIFAMDGTQSFTKELYPTVAEITGGHDWRLEKRDIRAVIHYAWHHRDVQLWNLYFPNSYKAPSNKVFICALTYSLQ